MHPIIQVAVLLLIVTVCTAVGWRLLSRRHLLPCPAGFIWMLENRIMENVASADALFLRSDIRPGMQVLDAGCGPGRLTIPLAQWISPKGKVTALDVQMAMLERVRQRAIGSAVDNIELLHAGLGDGSLAASIYDRALLVTVLGEIPDQHAALGEIFHALKPGGLLSITEVLPDPHYQTRRKVRKLGEANGFVVEEAYSSFRAYTLNLIKPFGA